MLGMCVRHAGATLVVLSLGNLCALDFQVRHACCALMQAALHDLACLQCSCSCSAAAVRAFVHRASWLFMWPAAAVHCTKLRQCVVNLLLLLRVGVPQARSMAARNSRTARWGNIIAGLVLMGFSVPFGLLGGYARKYHGPDSPYAEFAADTCSAPLGLPSCAQWVPDDKFVLFKYMWERVPRVSAARCSVTLLYLCLCLTAGWASMLALALMR
jgi:hypothetical protein